MTKAPPNEIEIRPFVKRGMMLVNTEALPIDDDDHVYNQVKALGLRPEDYGIRHPRTEEFAARSRDDLIEEIVQLRDTVLAYERWL